MYTISRIFPEDTRDLKFEFCFVMTCRALCVKTLFIAPVSLYLHRAPPFSQATVRMHVTPDVRPRSLDWQRSAMYAHSI